MNKTKIFEGGANGVFNTLIPLTQGKFAQVDAQDYEFLMQWKWHAQKSRNTFYAQRTVREGKKTKQVLMHRVILNVIDPKIKVDHRDTDAPDNGLNNRRDNLRVATDSQNCANRRKGESTTSKYKGVDYHKREKCWQARIKKDGKSKYLGYFETEEAAALAYNTAAIKFHGEFAKLNIV